MLAVEFGRSSDLLLGRQAHPSSLTDGPGCQLVGP